MKIVELKELVKKKLKTDEIGSISLSNIWKKPRRNILCLGVYGNKSLWSSSSYVCHLEMDFNGVVVSVLNARSDAEFKPLAHLIGKKIDLNSFEKDYQKIIKSRPVGVESCDYLGFINENGVHVFNHKNIDSFPLTEKYESNNERKEKHRNWEYVAEWKRFVKKYRKNIISSTIHNNGITYFKTYLKINGYSVSLELKSFFDYEVSIRIFSKKENKTNYNQSEVIELVGEEIAQFDSVMQELTSNNLSNLTKARILSNFSGVKHVSFSENNNAVVAEIGFDGERGRPKGKYEFQFDFKNNQIACSNVMSKKFIPQTIVELNQKIKLLEKNNYFFV
jgi:hypothetical protein